MSLIPFDHVDWEKYAERRGGRDDTATIMPTAIVEDEKEVGGVAFLDATSTDKVDEADSEEAFYDVVDEI